MCVPITLRYRPRDMFQLRRGNGYPPASVIVRLKELQLFRNRGRRSGRQVNKCIPVILSQRNQSKPAKEREYKHVEVPRLWYNLPTLLLSNVTSLSNKMEELTVTTSSTGADVIAITEAWQIVPEVCTIENYTLFHHLRTNKRGGGVALFCRSALSPSHLQVNPPQDVETLWVRLTPPCHPRHTASIIICVLYHPPRAPTAQSLIDHIIDTADSLRVRFPASKLIICGDFNRLDVGDIQHQLNLTQVVEFPTHQNSTLDLILTDMSQQYLPPQPLAPLGRSVHTSILWTPSPTLSRPKITAPKSYRPMPDSAMRGFGQWLVQHDWAEVTEATDVNTKWETYKATTNTAFNHFFPLKRFLAHPSDERWVTPQIKSLIARRNAAFHTDQATYRRLRNKIIKEIKQAKATYYPSKIQHLKMANNRQWYSRVKSLLGVGKHNLSFPFTAHLTSLEAAEEINLSFSTISKSLPPLDPSKLPSYLPSPSPPPTVQEIDVYKELRKLKSNRSTTPIDLPIKIYKEFAAELATPLCSIINASLSEYTCPKDWKVSYITPVPKVPSPQSFNDLRPIAITPIPSLICEGFVFEWAYADISKSIDIQQFGNMKASSTTHCLVSLLDFVHRNLDKRDTSIALALIDFRKAFDLVDHTVVINKAINLGLQPHLVAWLAAFVNGRKQAVRVNGAVSTLQDLTCGVPQGTKLGPLCFLALINDALSDTEHRWKYVDDSTVGISIFNKAPDFAPLQDTLDALQTWTEANSVTINHNKTVVMHVSTSTRPLPPPQLSVGRHPLQVVHHTKLLGVHLDDQMNWKLHVTATVRATSFKLYMLRRLRSLGAPPEDLCSIYVTFILPKLMYASPAWSSSLTLTQQRQLERVQKRACRIILGPAYNTYDDALATLSLPMLTVRHREALRKFGMDLLHHPRHRHLLPPAAPPPVRVTRHRNILLPPSVARTDRYKNSAVPSIVKIINQT